MIANLLKIHPSKTATKTAKQLHRALLLIGLTVLLSSCSLKDNAPLTVGVALEYAPFEYTNAQGELDGIDIQIMKAFGKYANRPIEFVKMDFSKLIPSISENKIDLAISAMTITENRMKIIDFSDPYFKTYPVLLINKKTTIKSGSDLNHTAVKIGVTEDTTGEILAQTLYANAEIVSHSDESVTIERLKTGDIDVHITDLIPAMKIYQDNKDILTINPSPLSDEFEYWGIGLHPKDKELKQQLNDFLIQFRDSGEMKTLIDLYLKDIQKELEQFDIPIYY